MHGVPGHRPTGRPGGREAALPRPRSEPGCRRRARAVRPATRGSGRTAAHRPDRGHRTTAALVAAGGGAGGSAGGSAGGVLPAGSGPIPARPSDTDDPAARHPDHPDRPGRAVRGVRSSMGRSRR
ncbi:hypothetical protein B9W64_07015 [Streptomyces sp. CS159]|nr:hypothetical protein B9W64_07015 [Streptomyces sp. CS159]